jgi:hypothetical protein
LDRSFISMLERGIQSPNLVVLFKALGVPAAEIVARAEAVMPNPRGEAA